MNEQINFFLEATENGKLNFALDADQEILIKILTHVYTIPEGKVFVDRLLEAFQTAYFNNEHGN